MPHAQGSDRLTTHPDGTIEIHSPLDKGWRGRRDRTRTTPLFPGTPVRWDDNWYEVLSVRRLTDGGCIYVLRTWPEDHAIRNPSRYDKESERLLLDEHDKKAKRTTTSRSIALAGLVIGHAPAHAQIEIEREYGFSAVSLSLLSLILPVVFAIWVAMRLPIRGLPPPYASPTTVLIAMLLFIETLVRLFLVLTRSTPLGSVLGLVTYELWRMTTPAGKAFEARAAVKAEKRLRTRSQAEADTATRERDEYSLREPFLSLLSPSEQQRLRTTFGFDAKKWGTRSVVVIAGFSALGAWSSLVKIGSGDGTFWTYSSLVAASLLLAEQIKRLTTILDGRPSGSVLGGLVRPWCRALLVRQPSSLKEGTVEAKPPDLPDVWAGDEPPDDQTGR